MPSDESEEPDDLELKAENSASWSVSEESALGKPRVEEPALDETRLIGPATGEITTRDNDVEDSLRDRTIEMLIVAQSSRMLERRAKGI